jgi:membrane associated rhomboid family serine protease
MIKSSSKIVRSSDSFLSFYIFVSACIFLSAFHCLDQTHSWDLETQFAFSLKSLKELKLWTLFTHSLLNDNPLELIGSMGSVVFFVQKLKKFYSGKTVTRFFFWASLAEAFSHALIEPENQKISGSLGIAIAFLLLYTLKSRNTPLFFLNRIPIHLPMVTAALILFDLFTLGSPWRPDHGSFAGHIGILFFMYFKRSAYLHTDSYYESLFSSQATEDKQQKKLKPPPSSSLESQVDSILEKISRQGIESLSDKERGLLDRASKIKNAKQ